MSKSFSWTTLTIPAIVVIAAVLYAVNPTLPPFYASLCSSVSPSGATELKPELKPELEPELEKPHQPSWNSWWHPEHSRSAPVEHRRSAGTTTSDWNILYHLGGNGPWIEKTSNVVEGGIAVPEGCVVEQVHMMSRHAERYPTKRAAQAQKAVVERMKKSGKIFTGDLAFFNEWNLFWTNDAELEQLTSTGPFSGVLSAFTTGVRLRTRYKHLISKALVLHPNSRTTVWASDSPRVKDTASNFMLGFWGSQRDDSPRPRLEVITEDPSAGTETLTPGRTCLANGLDTMNGRSNAPHLMYQYRATYLHPIRQRLHDQTGMEFNDSEIYAMQEMCGFEILVRGRTAWCNVFTRDEFLAFEYARDLLHYYRAGPGNKYAASMGWLWLNATTNLLVEGEKAGPLFFSFVHDGDIAPMITALDIMNDPHLPTTHILPDRQWRKSQVCPMGGRIIFELLSCGVGKFVRLNINDGITALPGCSTGPGQSCPLAQFAARTKKRGVEVGQFRKVCRLPDAGADGISFLRQH